MSKTPATRPAAGQTTPLPITDLVPYERNPRRGKVEIIKESLTRLGQYRPIVVNIGTHTGRSNEILAGNHTYEAARQLGWEQIDVFLVDVTDDDAKRIVLVDNRASDLATNDDELIAQILAELPDLDATGYSQDDLDKMLGGIDDGEDLDTGPKLGDIEYRIVVNCRDEAHQADLLERFDTEGLDCRAVMS